MQGSIGQNARFWIGLTVVLLSCLVSGVALYVKIYFWSGTHYAPLGTKVAVWFVVLAGPLAATILRKRRQFALALAACQFAIVAFASVT